MSDRVGRVAVLVVAVTCLLAVTGVASAATSDPRYDENGRIIETPFVPAEEGPQLHEKVAIELALSLPRVEKWVARYPEDGLTKTATYDAETKEWKVKVWSDRKDAGQIVLATVDDDAAQVTEAWIGPQVAWTMARGYEGPFGRKINEPWIWWPLAAIFFVGLASLRRPLSMRNLDLVVLLSFAASWWFFNQGQIFTSVPLAYPPLIYLLGRMIWLGVRGRSRAPSPPPFWPVWVLVAATVFIAGFRIGLNVEASNVIDVGYAGVIGAQRIVSEDQSPYGNFPVREGAECGPPDSEGNVRDRVQTNGRCETANDRGDTYGPIAYIAYVPGYLAAGWSGKWDRLPAAKATSLLFDGLTLVGLALVGWRFGRARLAATLTFAWVAYPFTTYVMSSNSNDTILPAILVWGFWLSTSAAARGALRRPCVVDEVRPVPARAAVGLVSGRPQAAACTRAVRSGVRGRHLARLLGAAARAGPGPRCTGLLGPHVRLAARPRLTLLGLELGRVPRLPRSPRPPDGSQGAVAGWRDRARVRSRRKSPLQLAALTAAVLIGFEIVLTHWFYLYIPWFLPFVAFALFVPALQRVEQTSEQPSDRPVGELVGAQA